MCEFIPEVKGSAASFHGKMKYTVWGGWPSWPKNKNKKKISHFLFTESFIRYLSINITFNEIYVLQFILRIPLKINAKKISFYSLKIKVSLNNYLFFKILIFWNLFKFEIYLFEIFYVKCFLKFFYYTLKKFFSYVRVTYV